MTAARVSRLNRRTCRPGGRPLAPPAAARRKRPLAPGHFFEVMRSLRRHHARDWRGLAWQSALGVAEAWATFADYDFARLCLGKGAA